MLKFIMKKNNNERKVIKVKLKDILHFDTDYSYFFKCIDDSNKLITEGCFFIRSFIIHMIDNNYDIPFFNIEFIRLAFSILANFGFQKKGRPFNDNTQKMADKLNEFLFIFIQNTSIQAYKYKNVSYILGQEYEKIYINIVNNIKLHFEKHITKFVKSKFHKKIEKLMENNKQDKISLLKKIQKDIVHDFLKNESSCVKYQKWINHYKKIILPDTYTEKSFESDVEKNTFKYLKCMYHINKYIQKKNLKSYQFFPIRSACYSKYVKINTSALIDIFSNGNKLENLKQAGNLQIQEQLWNSYFRLKNFNGYRYRIKNYSFNYEMETDGYVVSLNFINNNEIAKKEKSKENKRNGRLKANEIKKNTNDPSLYDKLKLEKKNKELDKKEKQKETAKLKRDQKKAEFKKLTQLEQEEVKSILNEKSEFPYIENLLKNKSLSDKFKEDFENGKLLFCDPGKRSLLYLMASNKINHKPNKDINNSNFGISKWKDRKIMNYTNRTRIKFTKRLEYNKLVEKWKEDQSAITDNDIEIRRNLIKKLSKEKKKNKKIIKKLKNEIEEITKSLKDIEKELCQENSKSCNLEEFLEYVKKKIEYNSKAKNQYNTEYLKKLKWYTYLNSRKHEDKLMNIIENEFGKDVKIIMGDWSNKGRLKFISTPNLSLKRKLAERFKVYHIDEYLTSKIHYTTNVKCENIYVSDETRKNNRRKLHAVLTYKKVDKIGCKTLIESGCINRDKNAILNMERIVKHQLENGERLSIFRRSTNQVYQNEKSNLGKNLDVRDTYRRVKNKSKNTHEKMNESKN